MARTATPRGRTAVVGTKPATPDAREKLKRILERDAAVQGERTEDAGPDARSPDDAGRPSSAGPDTTT